MDFYQNYLAAYVLSSSGQLSRDDIAEIKGDSKKMAAVSLGISDAREDAAPQSRNNVARRVEDLIGASEG